jgi:photosystem II stability/assembly factor-like uncharacterized protein
MMKLFARSNGILRSLALLAVTYVPCAAVSQTSPVPHDASPAVAGESRDAVLGAMQWRSIGPASVAGRIDDFAVLNANPNLMYVGTATGGVWKTIDGGIVWKPVFEHVGPMSIGAVAVSQRDSSTVWAGTGEANNRQSSSWGGGVYKSSDGGSTWAFMGLAETQHIGRIAIDPTNTDVVYVAALGHLWGANEDRGLYKTIDGGKTWKRVLFLNQDTGVVDVKLDPSNPSTLYAAAYERRRTVFGFNGGGPASALYKSTDGGASWARLTQGLPYADGGDTGRIGIAVYPRDSRIIYAEVQHEKGGLFRSDDAGVTWKKMSDVNPNAPYFSNFYIDPNNDLRIWVAALQGSGQIAGVALSEDGGKTFMPNRGVRVHPDFHAMWIDPADSGHMIIGVDGGMYVSRDLGNHWQHLNNIPIGQAYHVGFDMAQPYNVCAGFQDNGSAWGPSRTRGINGIHNGEWMDVLAGDGFTCQPDLDDANLIYVESQDGTLLRLNLTTHEWANVVPQPKPDDDPYRFEWNAPMIVSTHKTGRIYFGAQYLFRSDDRGDSWQRISPDLTTGVDRNKLPILGKTPPSPILSRNYGVEWYPTITRISESPVDETVVWAGAQDGSLQVTEDGGKTWHSVAATLPHSAQGLYVSGIDASHASRGGAYITLDGHNSDDFNSHVYFTPDFGKTWQSLTDGLPHSAGVTRVVREDPVNPNLLFLGTEFGAFLSLDRGHHWTLMTGSLPTVRVDDIRIQPREHDLILATYGRSLWILDDLMALENPGVTSEDGELDLFGIRKAISYRQIETTGAMDGDLPFEGENPAYGALINYRLKRATKEPVKIKVSDTAGNLVREFEGTGDAGINRVSWDLHYPTFVKPTAEQEWAVATGFFYQSVEGPLAEPGTYTVEVATGSDKVSTTVDVIDDPKVTISSQDRAARRQVIVRAYGLYKAGVDADKQFKAVKTNFTTVTEDLKKSGAAKASPALQASLDAFSKELDSLSPLFMTSRQDMAVKYVPPPVTQRIARVLFIVESYTAAPRKEDVDQLDDLVPVQEEALRKLRTLVDVDLVKLNAAMRDANILYIKSTE